MTENNESQTKFLFKSNDKFTTLNEKSYLTTLERCLKYNKLDCFILGVCGPELVWLGQKAFDYYLAVRAIYHVYAEKNINIRKDLVEAMNKIYCTRNFNDLRELIFFCNAHMYYANRGEAPFEIDAKTVYQGIKNNLDKNKDIYDTYYSNEILKSAKKMVEMYN